MKVYSDNKLETYQVSGHELRIHWDQQQVERSDSEIAWESNEALCNVYDDRPTLIQKIIGSELALQDEIAIINNQTDKPEAYAEYQAFRAKAKALADGRITLGGVAGTVTLNLSATVTAAIPANQYAYDLELVSGSGQVTRLLEGFATVDAEVTR